MSSGIYSFLNKINGKRYIGLSKNLAARKNIHYNEYKNINSKEYEKPLYRAMRKYGEENFNYSILEYCSETELESKEIFWINFYDSYKNGYNATCGGDGVKGFFPETSSAGLNEIKVLEIISLLKTSRLTMQKIGEKYNIAASTVSNINIGHSWNRFGLTYPIRNGSTISGNVLKFLSGKTKGYVNLETGLVFPCASEAAVWAGLTHPNSLRNALNRKGFAGKIPGTQQQASWREATEEDRRNYAPAN